MNKTKTTGGAVILGLSLWVFFMPSLVYGNKLTEEIVHAMRDRVLVDYPFVSSEDVSIQIQDKENIQIPQGSKRFEIGLSKIQTSLGLTSIPVTFLDTNGNVLSLIQVWVKADAKAPFVKSARTLKKGELLVTADVKIMVQSIYGAPLNGFREVQDVVGKEVRHAVGQNSFLTAQTVQEKVLIHRGDRVMGTIRESGIEIQIKMDALQEGRRNDWISLKPYTDSKKVVKGKVVDEKNVSLDRSH